MFGVGPWIQRLLTTFSFLLPLRTLHFSHDDDTWSKSDWAFFRLGHSGVGYGLPPCHYSSAASRGIMPDQSKLKPFWRNHEIILRSYLLRIWEIWHRSKLVSFDFVKNIKNDIFLVQSKLMKKKYGLLLKKFEFSSFFGKIRTD